MEKNCFSKSLNELTSKRNPFLPCSKSSLGPFGQLLESIVLFIKPASIKTKPGSSHKDVKIKILAFSRYL